MNQEVHHNSHEQVVGYLVEALAAVREAEIPEHLEVPAFQKALEMVAAKNIYIEQPSASPIGIPRMTIPRGRNGQR